MRATLISRVFAATIALAIIACSGEPETSGAAEPAAAASASNLIKATPVLLADDVQACIDFWEAYGLTAVATVPGDDGPSFAILTNGAIEMMYQTFASALADNPAAVEGVNRTVLFIEVASLDEIKPVAEKGEIVVPERLTDYGAREIYVRDPAGHLIGFAQQGAAE